MLLTISGTQRKAAGDVEVALDPSELEGLSQEQLQQRYEASRRAAAAGKAQAASEDVSDVYAAEMAKRRKKGAPPSFCGCQRVLVWLLTRMRCHRGGPEGEVQVLSVCIGHVAIYHTLRLTRAKQHEIKDPPHRGVLCIAAPNLFFIFFPSH
jgi:hypothetical protein